MWRVEYLKHITNICASGPGRLRRLVLWVVCAGRAEDFAAAVWQPAASRGGESIGDFALEGESAPLRGGAAVDEGAVAQGGAAGRRVEAASRARCNAVRDG